MKRLLIFSLVTTLGTTAISSCSYDPYVRQGQRRGAVVGGIAGGLIDDSWGGAAVGAAVGGMIGGAARRNDRYYY